MISRILPAAFAAFIFNTTAVTAQNSVKVGVLHSLSGTMAISETSLRDACSSPLTKSTPPAA